jgi:simple sugar transport system permease protein
MNIFIGMINGMISAATPILLAALGGALTYYAGIFNIAMEGMMLSGAFFAVLGSYYFSSWPLGILAAILGAILMGLIFILFAVYLKVDEFITGIGLNLFAVGLTTYMLRQIFAVKGAFSDPGIVSIPRLDIPWVRNIPVIGEVVSGQNLIVYLTILATGLVFYLVFKTRFGLRLRAAGYNRTCLDTSGVSAVRIRITALFLCAVLCGLAGSFLSLGYVTLFSEGMSAGRGWISLAAVIMVSGNPLGIALISLLFGFTDGLGLFMQRSVPSQFTSMVPYIATLIALFVYSMRLKKKQAV